MSEGKLHIKIKVDSYGGSIEIDMPDTKREVGSTGYKWLAITPPELMHECKQAVKILQGREEEDAE